MKPIETYISQSRDGVYHGVIRIKNEQGEQLDFKAAAMRMSDVERCLYSILLELRDEVNEAGHNISESSKRAASHEHNQQKKKRAANGTFRQITRLMIKRTSKTEVDHVCDIDYFLPNLQIGSEIFVNGLCFAKVAAIYNTVDYENKFVMITVLLKEE